MKNKLAKGLGLGALVLGLSGCSSRGNETYLAPEVPEAPGKFKNLSTDDVSRMDGNEFEVNTDYFSFDCDPAKVRFFDFTSYEISCDFKRTFQHANDGDVLFWDNVMYHDKDADGAIDYMWVEGVEYQGKAINPQQNEAYKNTLKHLNKDLVHKVWKDNWSTEWR